MPVVNTNRNRVLAAILELHGEGSTETIQTRTNLTEQQFWNAFNGLFDDGMIARGRIVLTLTRYGQESAEALNEDGSLEELLDRAPRVLRVRERPRRPAPPPMSPEELAAFNLEVDREALARLQRNRPEFFRGLTEEQAIEVSRYREQQRIIREEGRNPFTGEIDSATPKRLAERAATIPIRRTSWQRLEEEE